MDNSHITDLHMVNGWTNFATYKVHMELFNEQFDYITELWDQSDRDEHEFAQKLEDYLCEYFDYLKLPTLVRSCCIEFLSQVDFINLANAYSCDIRDAREEKI